MVEWFVINALTVYKMELFTVLTDFIKSKCFFQTNYITPSDYECIILLEKGGLMREIYLPCSTYRNIDILIAYLLIERRKNKKTTSRYKHDITWLQIAIFPDGAKNDGVFRLFSDFTCDFCINRLKNTSFITSNPANLTVWHDVYCITDSAIESVWKIAFHFLFIILKAYIALFTKQTHLISGVLIFTDLVQNTDFFPRQKVLFTHKIFTLRNMFAEWLNLLG